MTCLTTPLVEHVFSCHLSLGKAPSRPSRIFDRIVWKSHLNLSSTIALRKRISQNYRRLIRCLQSQIKTDNPVSNDQPRPISVLPVLSKVFEKPAVSQMAEYADSAHLPHDQISNLRKGHSTTTALLGIRDNIRYAIRGRRLHLCQPISLRYWTPSTLARPSRG